MRVLRVATSTVRAIRSVAADSSMLLKPTAGSMTILQKCCGRRVPACSSALKTIGVLVVSTVVSLPIVRRLTFAGA